MGDNCTNGLSRSLTFVVYAVPRQDRSHFVQMSWEEGFLYAYAFC